jgi:phenylalanyl-tRNA synthetase beta chain
MKVTYNWLKDFVDITLSPEKLSERLTMAGLEVESCEKTAGDTVFTIEVTSNRPDWLSVGGIAREIAAITGKKLNSKEKEKAGIKYCVPGTNGSGKEKVEIVIEDKKDCPLYTARVIRDVTCARSPEWMRARLESVGVRSINNIVDITNYVLFELGEPLHAFDLDKLELPVKIRRAKPGEKIIAIDGKEYTLDPSILVIADARRAIAIAGVMGGKDTEVSASTKNVLLEAALFSSVLVRRGRQKLGLQSEASYRFERGVDPHAPGPASLRACALIQELAGGRVAGQKSCGSAAEKTRTISLAVPRVAEFLDIDISAFQIKQILSSLGFMVTAKGGKAVTVKVPSFRRDVKMAIDLIEEIARIYGYDNVPSRLPAMIMQSSVQGSPPLIGLRRYAPSGAEAPGRTCVQAQQKPSLIPAVKESLMAQGLDEVLTFSLIDRKCVADFYQGADIVEIANPLSSEQEIMRPVLMPSLCRCVAYNLNQRQPNAAVFEIAKSYVSPDRERNVLGIAVAGDFLRWFGPAVANVAYEAGFLNLKGMIETLAMRLGIDPSECSYEYSGALFVYVRIKGNDVGVLKQLSAKELALFDIKDTQVFLAEISLDQLLAMAEDRKVFQPFPRFPSISRDITLELSAEISVENILAAARSGGTGLMRSAAFRNYYDKNLPAGTKRITITCVYSAEDRTLTEAEIAPVHSAVVEKLKATFSAQIR